MARVLEFPKKQPKARDRATPLTAARIRQLASGSRQYWVPDGGCPGLYVRVTPSGEMSFYVRGRIGTGRNARQRNIRIGGVNQIGLAQARKHALAIVSQMRSGIDPRVEAEEHMTVGDLIGGYGLDLERRGVVNAKSAVSSLNRNLKRLKSTAAAVVRRADLVKEIERCADRSGPAAATAFRGFAAAMLNWAVNAGHLQSSVLAGYKAPRMTKAERLSRSAPFTVQGANAIRRFWQATDASRDPVFRDYMRFLLLTGQRRNETAAMRWEDLSSDHWSIPAEVTKTGRDHVVPLGPVSLSLLGSQPRQSSLVWPGRGDVPMAGWSKRLRPVKSAMGEPQLAMHSLRRGYRTGIRELGADTDLCEAMIGHSRRGLIARYDKSEMWEARVQIQTHWESWIRDVTRTED
ncbi:integrase family protein [Tropicimonas sp. IMCC6043]|uniref:tyrosine-type recombinase/integrase n=1 Tax=Tropicimonas sp. IMCC6043 TaxID=2510645 RepID=UPI0013ECA619|nr:integrase family protein [Tropicimonas sp. IMCC6043]